MPPWGRGSFSLDDTGQQRSYKFRDSGSFGCCFQYKWDPGVWIIVAEVTELRPEGTRDTAGHTFGLRKRSALELKDSAANTTFFCHGLGVPMGSYGTVVVSDTGGRALRK
jgi:hypothetical protein